MDTENNIKMNIKKIRMFCIRCAVSFTSDDIVGDASAIEKYVVGAGENKIAIRRFCIEQAMTHCHDCMDEVIQCAMAIEEYVFPPETETECIRGDVSGCIQILQKHKKEVPSIVEEVIGYHKRSCDVPKNLS